MSDEKISRSSAPKGIRLLVPIMPPSVNHSKGFGKKIYTTPEVKEFKRAVFFYAMRQRFDLSGIEGCELELTIRYGKKWYTKKGLPKRNDVGNYLKYGQDALMDALDVDDKWIKRTILDKIDSEKIFTEYILLPIGVGRDV